MDFIKQYKSGLKLVARKMDSVYTVSFGVFVNVGSVKEDASTNGYSHFIEHLLFKGTQKRTCLEISEAIDDIGASINAYTAKDVTCFYTKSAHYDLEKCMDVLSDMYFNATIPQEELDRERGVVIEEIKMYQDTPDDVCQDLASSALFGEQTLGQTILGTVDNIKYSDRHSILKFKNKYYIPSNTVISVCGKLDFDQVDKLVEQYFESNCTGTLQVSAEEPKVKYLHNFEHCFKDVEQAHVQLSWGGCSLSSQNRHATTMLASILGGGLSSRLNQEIREKHGLAYSIYAYPSYYVQGGAFEIYAGLSPQNVQQACDLIAHCLKDLLANGVTEKELARVRMQAINALYMNIESNLTLMRLCGKTLLKLGEQFDVEKEIANYKSVTLQDINNLAKQIFAQKHATVYVGPKADQFDVVSKFTLA